MNYKISFAALAVASVLSSQAMAATGDAMNAVNALRALGEPTPSGYTGLDGDVTNTGVWTADATDDANACTFAGVLCDGSNEMTKFEMPNANWAATGGLPAVLTALDPVKDTLLNLNVSNTSGPNNVLAGGFAGLDGFTSLLKLALNNISATGDIPDMSAATNLNWVNVSDNPSITGMGAKLAGGSEITLLQAANNTAMSGDMTATFAGLGTIVTPVVTLDDTKLYGTLNTDETTGVNVAGSDIIVTGAGAANSGYDETTVVQAATGVTAGDGEGTISVSWVAPSVGAQTGYNVSYSTDGGETLSGTTAVPGANTQTYTLTNVPAGTYKAVVQATGPDDRMGAAALSADFTSTSSGPDPLVCEDGQEPNAAGTECVDEEEEEVTTGSGGGGAALWLAFLPLMGLLRRKRA